MHADEDRIFLLVRDCDSLTKGEKDVIPTGEQSFEPARLKSLFETERHVEGVVLFPPERANRSRVMSTVSGIDHNSIEIDGLFDVTGTKNRIDEFGEVNRGKHCFPSVVDDGKTKIELHIVHIDRLRTDLPGHDEIRMLENPIVAFLREALKPVELGDVFVGDVFSTSELVDLPVTGLQSQHAISKKHGHEQ